MDFTTLSIEHLCEFLCERRVPGTEKVISEEVATSLRENCIDGATLLMLMEDLSELREVIPNTAHRVQLKRLILDAKASKCDTSSPLASPNPKGAAIQIVTLPEPNSPRDPLTPVKAQHNIVPNHPVTSTPKPSSVSAKPSPTTMKQQKSTPVPKVKENDDEQCLPINIPIPDRFSIRVEEGISRNEVLAVRLQLIKDAGNFYYGLCRHPKQGDYGRMAKKLCERFPELKDVDSDSYWTSVQKQLSMFFRNQRRLSKRVFNEKENSPKPTTSTAKKMKVSDDVVAATRNLDLLKKTKKSDFSTETFNTLIEETYKQRRDFIQHKAGSVVEIIEQCPFLGDPLQVNLELVRILGPDKVAACKVNLLESLPAVLKVKGQLSNKQTVDAIAEVQRRTRKKALPGKLISFHDASTPPGTLFKSKLVEFVIVCIGTPEDVEQVFIVGESNVIYECPTTCLVDALVNLISCYYVFDVSYPVGLEGILFFIQDVGLRCLDKSFRYSKYNSFLAELKNFHDKCDS